MLRSKGDSISTIKGVLVAYLVLILHVLLVGLLGILVLFFRGIVNYMIWIFLIGMITTLLFAIYLYRKIKFRSGVIKKFIHDAPFDDRPLEVNLLGGLASFRLGSSLFRANSGSGNLSSDIPQIELYESSRIREITELAGLLERKLITVDEYNEAKRDIFSL